MSCHIAITLNLYLLVPPTWAVSDRVIKLSWNLVGQVIKLSCHWAIKPSCHLAKSSNWVVSDLLNWVVNESSNWAVTKPSDWVVTEPSNWVVTEPSDWVFICLCHISTWVATDQAIKLSWNLVGQVIKLSCHWAIKLSCHLAKSANWVVAELSNRVVNEPQTELSLRFSVCTFVSKWTMRDKYEYESNDTQLNGWKMLTPPKISRVCWQLARNQHPLNKAVYNDWIWVCRQLASLISTLFMIQTMKHQRIWMIWLLKTWTGHQNILNRCMLCLSQLGLMVD